MATSLVSLITFMTPMASSMIAPAADSINEDLHVHAQIVTSLIFSIFLLAFVVGPIILAPMSEVYGRLRVLQLANIWFLIWCLACGFAQNTGEMLAFRFLSGLGACAPQSIGGGVLSDMWSAEERGTAIAIYSLAPLLGPSVGPLMGAWVTETIGWRWSFWILVIFGTCIQVVDFIFLKETFAPRILHLKASRLRKETGNADLHTKYEGKSYGELVRTSLTRVMKLLFTQPIMQFLALMMALFYGLIYLILATYPIIWDRIYHESTGIAGLNYISLMIGCAAGAETNALLLNFIYRRLTARSPDGKGRPEFRVPTLLISSFLVFAGLLIMGWTAQKHCFWLAPNIGTVLFGAGVAMSFAGLQSYTIDAYQMYAASAVGATAIARSVTGFSFPLFATQMYDGLGFGWGNTILAFASLVIGYGGAGVLWFYGERLRKASPFATGE